MQEPGNNNAIIKISQLPGVAGIESNVTSLNIHILILIIHSILLLKFWVTVALGMQSAV